MWKRLGVLCGQERLNTEVTQMLRVLCVKARQAQTTQRGRAATKHVRPNGVRPCGERRSALGRAPFGPGARAARPYTMRKIFAACEEDCN